MSEKLKIRRGDTADVREEIIDFGPLETASRDDDGAWNAMKLYGEDDKEEGVYQPSKALSPKELEAVLKRAKAAKIGQSILDLVA